MQTNQSLKKDEGQNQLHIVFVCYMQSIGRILYSVRVIGCRQAVLPTMEINIFINMTHQLRLRRLLLAPAYVLVAYIATNMVPDKTGPLVHIVCSMKISCVKRFYICSKRRKQKPFSGQNKRGGMRDKMCLTSEQFKHFYLLPININVYARLVKIHQLMQKICLDQG